MLSPPSSPDLTALSCRLTDAATIRGSFKVCQQLVPPLTRLWVCAGVLHWDRAIGSKLCSGLPRSAATFDWFVRLFDETVRWWHSVIRSRRRRHCRHRPRRLRRCRTRAIFLSAAPIALNPAAAALAAAHTACEACLPTTVRALVAFARHTPLAHPPRRRRGDFHNVQLSPPLSSSQSLAP